VTKNHHNKLRKVDYRPRYTILAKSR